MIGIFLWIVGYFIVGVLAMAVIVFFTGDELPESMGYMLVVWPITFLIFGGSWGISQLVRLTNWVANEAEEWIRIVIGSNNE